MKILSSIVVLLPLVEICWLQEDKQPKVTFGIVEEYFTEKFVSWNRTRGFQNYIKITCETNLDTIPPNLSFYQPTTPLDIIIIENCLLPQTPLDQVFSKLHFNTKAIDTLILNNTVVPPNARLSLDVKNLVISNIQNATSEFYALSPTLIRMTIENMEMPELVPLNENQMRPKVLTLRNTTINKWTNCEKLYELHITEMTKDGIPEEWPKNCSQLNALFVFSIPSDAVDKFLASIRHKNLRLGTIVMKNCSLIKLPMTLINYEKNAYPGLYFECLDFSDNGLEDDAFLQFNSSEFSLIRQLNYLNLSNNRLKGGFIKYLASHLTGMDDHETMYELNLDGNNMTSLCGNYSVKSALVQLPKLRQLSINRMDLEPDCLMHTFSFNLERLNMQPSHPRTIEHLKLNGFPKTKSKQLIVDLRGLSVKYMSIRPTFIDDFDNMDARKHWFTNSTKLKILLDAVDCDCNNDILAKVLRKYPQYLSMPALKCTEGGQFIDQPMEKLDCKKAFVKGCMRRIHRQDNSTVVDCSHNTEKLHWPKPDHFIGFNVSGQNITTLKNAYLPKSLELLDLRNNNISSLSKADLLKLFLTPSRRIWMSGNPIRCHCENAAFIKALQGNKSQIVDYYDLVCSDGMTFSKVSVFEICKTGKQVLRFFKSGRPIQRVEKRLRCPSQLEEKEPYAIETVVHAIYIYNCDLSVTPIASVLMKLNISITSLDTLHLTNTTFSTSIPENFTSGLNIRKLKLTHTSLPEKFFNGFSSQMIYTISIENMDGPVIPSHINLQELSLRRSSVKNWENCVFLQDLSISFIKREQLPKDWPEKCARLKNLKLESLSTETAHNVEESIKDVVSLISLTIKDCGLTELPLKLIKNTERIEDLNFTGNKLDDTALDQLPILPNLKSLDLSNNKLTGEFIVKITEKVPELQTLLLDDNYFMSAFCSFGINSALTKLIRLERLSLNRMKLDPECFMHSKFRSLMYLDIISNSSAIVTNFKMYGLPSTGAKYLQVNLQGRPFGIITLDSEFYISFDEVNPSELWITTKGYKLTVLIDSVDCDCNNDMLSRALQEFPGFLSMPNVKCHQNNGLLLEQPMRVLDCRRAKVHGCRRKISRHYKYVTRIDCSYNSEKFLWPQPQNFLSLNASGNHITTIHKAFLPGSLLWLDLSRNNISRLDVNDTTKLFTPAKRRVWLAHNPIACECDNWDMINALQTNHTQIVDYDSLQCAGSKQLVRLISVEELCRVQGPEAAWAIVSVLAFLVMMAGLLLRQYWRSLQMILYARSCCLSCLSDEELDSDRPYDAFLSFAHGDDEYVMEKLLPRLEGEPNFYRICVHYRDWMIGDSIPAQIMRSVRASKRTVIVLSQKFVRSCWGVLEFRYAHANAMSEGRSRLLVIVLDDVLAEDLSPELRGYLDLNTYLRCDDPWFWEKLQYAMPHVKGKKRSRPSYFSHMAPNVSYPPSEMLSRIPRDASNLMIAENEYRSTPLNESSENGILQPNSLLIMQNETVSAENSPAEHTMHRNSASSLSLQNI